jgi:hypothetical protein
MDGILVWCDMAWDDNDASKTNNNMDIYRVFSFIVGMFVVLFKIRKYR